MRTDPAPQASPMAPQSQASAPHARPGPARHRYALRVAVEGDLRFLPHLDVVRMFARAAVRARLRVSHSAGYNPHPHIALPLPRNVGVASIAEVVRIDLVDDVPPSDLVERFNAVLPAGCRVSGATRVASDRPPHPRSATYELRLVDGETATLQGAVARLQAAERLEIDRPGGPGRPARRIDVRPFILELSLSGEALRVKTRVGQDGTVRPAELLKLLGQDPDETLHRMRRVSVEWDMESLAEDR